MPGRAPAHDEGRTFTQGFASDTEQQYVQQVDQQYGAQAPAVLAHHPWSAYASPYTAAYALGAIWTDSGFLPGIGGCPTQSLAATFARRSPTFFFQFDDRHAPGLNRGVPGYQWGAGHAMELVYLWPSFTNGYSLYDLLTPAQLQLSAQMVRWRGAFTRLGAPAAAGQPAWPSYAAGRLMSLRPGDRSETIPAGMFAAEHQCSFWNARSPGKPLASGSPCRPPPAPSPVTSASLAAAWPAAVSTGPRRCGNPHVCALSGHHGEPRALYTPVVDHSAGAAALARPRVTSLLSAAWQRRTTLVVAGGGYGKTTALRDIAAMGTSSWVTLRPADGLTETLAARLAAALGAPEDQSALAAATGADDRRGLAEQRAALLCGLAEQHAGDQLLVLDDLESVGDDDAAGDLLRVLCLQAPPQLHIVLSGRRVSAPGLGTARGRGEVLEVTAPDLAFTVAETGQLLAARLGPQAAELAGRCCALTGGWAAALQLLIDRLSRLAPADRPRALDRLGRHGTRLWRAFADELVAGEPARTRRILGVAWAGRRVSARLLDAVGLPGSDGDLDGLHQRGLLVEAGDADGFALSPVLADSAAGQLAGADALALRETVASWFEEQNLLEEALECRFDAGPDGARGFAARCGPALVRRGGAARLAEVLRRHGTGGDPVLDAVLAEALQATGDWDGAIEVFSRLQQAAGPRGLPPAVAWRFGVLLYLRGQSARALQMLSAAHSPGLVSADDAMVSAFLSTTLWSRGDLDAAGDLAEVALRQADASADACARAAAYVAEALVAAGRGQRDRNEQAYRRALTAAAEAGDRVQLARIHANLSSRALEEGDYAAAVTEAGLALSTGAGHRYFSALALSNKADAHLRLGELDAAREALTEALDTYAALGSLDAAVPQHLLAELHRQTGNLARARSAFERARDLAEENGDTHTQVHVLCGLARTLAATDPDAARQAAGAAVRRATSLELAAALCASAEVELWAGQPGRVAELAGQAEAAARRTRDRAALAEALELRGAAAAPPGQEQLQAAVELWDDIGNLVAANRARLALAAERGQDGAARDARRRLADLGVAVGIGAAGLLAARHEAGAEVSITTLGRFAVIRGGEHVALTAWQSRKARDLLKLLAARRGRPVTREGAAEALWPGQATEPLGNRLSVALSTIRKVLDPGRARSADYYLVADGQSIALRMDRVSVDVAEFLDTAAAAVTAAAGPDPAAAGPLLQRAWALYAGDFLEDDPYEDWAAECREEARSAALMVLRLLARLAAARGRDEAASQHLSQLLERDPYDEDAWLALVAAQLRLHRHGEARRRYAAYARRMAELDVVPVPLAGAAGRQP